MAERLGPRERGGVPDAAQVTVSQFLKERGIRAAGKNPDAFGWPDDDQVTGVNGQSRRSTGSISSASTPKMHSCTRRRGSRRTLEGRGRAGSHEPPPTRIPAGAFRAPGSCLGCLA